MITTELTPDRIRQVRLALGMSQSKFARSIGCSLRSVIRYEAGGSVPVQAVRNTIQRRIQSAQKRGLMNDV